MFWGVQIFQVSCEIYVLGGPNILKYKDWEEPFFWGGPIFFMTATPEILGYLSTITQHVLGI